MYNDKSYNDKSAGASSGAFVFWGDYNEEFFGGLRRRNNELDELTNFVGRRMGRQ